MERQQSMKGSSRNLTGGSSRNLTGSQKGSGKNLKAGSFRQSKKDLLAAEEAARREEELLAAIRNGDEAIHGGENFDWHSRLLDVYTVLKDTRAPDDAKRDAALKCWQLAEHRNRRSEQKRQKMVACYGDYPQVHGLLMDVLVTSESEEVQWRCARALVQLCYGNPDTSWLVMHNNMRETKKRTSVLVKRLAELRQSIANEDDNIEKSKNELPNVKEKLAVLQARKSGPFSLSYVLAGKTTSFRVMECVLHALNNMANSCWEGHALILRDKVHLAAAALLEDYNMPAFVVSAASGFLCSLSYKPETRASMRDSAMLAGLGRICELDQSEYNSLSCALALANITGALDADQGLEVTPSTQVAIKAVNALQAGINREQSGARYLTVWKVMYACVALASHPRNHLTIAQFGLPVLLVQLLEATSVNPKTEQGCLDCLLNMCFEKACRDIVVGDAPMLYPVLEGACISGSTE
eukprot:CAMPEP_0206232606 /NCGR_PEP_ID=MMETSP0047_2-20121206/11511_1 /ASSEMBLY_ACC=CAM_ASM_000192 /TAXON_ID=195065 /ORGANISM="Chroomonas mesostigmatica_cf, Strain CCMP1168" /LENGTH=467 /DNA_ID=CAMNT_0053656365 /DNA_START=284 /DNA_END=1684 /DNA_ORIENTATION=+